ncbi:phage regulatory CII family protein [Erythrobacter sp. HA6-11]
MNGAPQKVRERSLKIATGELQSLCGGQEAAASIVGKSQSQLQRCASVNDADNFLNLRDAALLEAHAGEHPVTELLCRIAGGVFLVLPDPALGDSANLPMQVIELADELGDVSHAVRDALRDGQVNRAEAGEIERQLDQLIDKAVEARAMVQAMQGKDVQIMTVEEARELM